MEITRINTAFILLFAFLIEALSTPVPTKVVNDEVNTIGKGDVGVSWGGYSASAGLGGGSAGGVLRAGAYAPGVGASAGLGGYAGGVASGDAGASSGAVGGGNAGASGGAGAGVGVNHGPGHNQQAGGNFFDNIFNIPISVLKAVNTYLNQKGTTNGEHPAPPPHNHHHNHHHEAGVVAGVAPQSPNKPVESHAAAGAVAQASASASAGAGSSGYTGNHAAGTAQVHPNRDGNYDDVFNIPIAALKSVNQLLGGQRT